MTCQHQYPRHAIAIVGSACRFAGGVDSPSKLWELLANPRDVISEIPQSRFDVDKVFHPDPFHSGTSNVRHSYFLEQDHRMFDAQFFGVKPSEAVAIDPQQRILLETAYEALEAAGIPIQNIQGSNMGVYVGLMTEEYSKVLGADMQNIPSYFGSGTARNNTSNRISYFFDLHGPSMTIDTACSSSLVALHQAVLSLRNGEINSAIVAGANLILTSEQYIVSSKLKMLSSSGRSRMWDSKADGYGRGEGFGILIVKTLEQALLDGDDIECIIRETGVNQDGRTKGLTMPNASAQADLIRSTYEKAGLDLNNPLHHPQFFEAHGTGTPAGDPIEAEAINNAFCSRLLQSATSRLLVGSAKTILGHTEGTAGILGVMKAMLAMKHGQVPPNMLLEKLNPAIKPFYNGLHVPSTSQTWPTLPRSSPKRASVNSFGFGGTNAHAIIEEFMGRSTSDHCTGAVLDTSPNTSQCSDQLIPFNFSAASESSLRSVLSSYACFLCENPDINLADLSWTLNNRRSRLPVRTSIVAQTVDELVNKLELAATSTEIHATSEPVVALKPRTTRPQILAIFTGQGAQWATMGRNLLQSSTMVVDCFEALQESLDSLPNYTPTWCLREELLRDEATSRIREGKISQPLCTAVQIALTQLIKAAGISFGAVVGHSSGEIASAYAAGYISAKDAIRIAYLRGYFVEKAGVGAMLAAGTSFEDAQHLCGLRQLVGRICVAAVNSPTSVTLSGDTDAIQDALEILEDEGKFARLLRVDKAYHSHHMAPIVDMYVGAIQESNIKLQARSSHTGHTTWISSVTGKPIEMTDLVDLEGKYWGDNMKEPVLFSAAITNAVQLCDPFSVALEVGPHPALKSPASKSISAVTGNELPYISTLNRGQNDTEAFSTTLGSLWQHSIDVQLDAFAERPPKLLKGLPTYAWDHSTPFWQETRRARASLQKGDGSCPHPLLGTRCRDESEGEIRFRNHLTVREVPWLADHCIQDQVVFPGSAYLCMCLEAVVKAFPLPVEQILLVELRQITIRKALVLKKNKYESQEGAELLLRINIVEDMADHILATFSISSSSDAANEGTGLSENCSGEVMVLRRQSSAHNGQDTSYNMLPLPKTPYLDEMAISLQSSTFYDWARNLGYGYNGYFTGLADMRRKMNASSGRLKLPPQNDLLLHPATLDLAIQSILLAYSCPGDGRLRSMHMPTKIDTLRIDVLSCQMAAQQSDDTMQYFSTVASTADLTGNVELHNGKQTFVQMEGLYASPITPRTAENDVKMFFEMDLMPEYPIALQTALSPDRFEEDYDLGIKAERLACCYLQKLAKLFPKQNRDGMLWYHARLMEYVDFTMDKLAGGKHAYGQPEWMESTEEVAKILEANTSIIDFKILKAVGTHLPSSISDNGKTNMWEILNRDGMLEEYYQYGQGMPEYLDKLAGFVAQLSHRFAHMDILELGAGTGAATCATLKKLNGAFRSFTFTDISSNFFAEASQKFSKHRSQLKFAMLDIEKPIEDQGFTEASYDVVIASLVLHATTNLDNTLANVRALLRPGGYLVVLELTEVDAARVSLVFGSFPGWWSGSSEDGRHLSPCISPRAWETAMRRTGFSKIDGLVSGDSRLPVPLSVLVCQAVDDRIELLRSPLAIDTPQLGLGCLTVIGKKDFVSENSRKHLEYHYQTVQYVGSLDDMLVEELPTSTTVLSLVDALPDELSTFETLTQDGFEAIQKLFRLSKTILWVTHGCLSEMPHRNMFRGLARSAKLEMSGITIQTLDFDRSNDFKWETVLESLLRLEVYDSWAERAPLTDLLWKREPELFVRDGVLMVPRLKQSQARNDRYNSTQRLISNEVDPKDTVLEIVKAQNSFKLQKSSMLPSPFGSHVQLLHSIPLPVPVGRHSGFISVGRHVETKKHVVLLSKSLESSVQPPPAWILPLPNNLKHGREVLWLLRAQLVGRAVLKAAVTTKCLVLLNPDPITGDTVLRLAAVENIRVQILTTKPMPYRVGWTQIKPFEMQSNLQKLLPQQRFCFVNMGVHESIANRIDGCLLSERKIGSLTHLTHDCEDLDFSPQTIQDVSTHFQSAYACLAAKEIDSVDVRSLYEFTLRHLVSSGSGIANTAGNRHDTANYEQAILSWETELGKIPIQVKPASSLVEFLPQRTYWFVGLTGGLAPGLCEFMASKGATHIALSSRNPKVSVTWIESMKSRGCIIRVLSSDVTNYDSLESSYREITSSMPPVAGVAQAAMVLRDAVLPDQTYGNLQETLAPKVSGSIHLDKLFSKVALDFFIFFSSMAYVAGNRGQSAYTAANAFMASLAARRRKRGLTASVINLGGIVGEGYITRQLASGKQSELIKAGFEFQSEQAFHEMFCEAMLSGRSDSTEDFEISAGVRFGESSGTLFASNPIFQHLVSHGASPVSSDTVVSKHGKVSTKAQLASAATESEAHDIVQEGLISKLETILGLQLEASTIMPQSPDQLGIDSLVAVELQSWLAKDIGIDMSVMAILNTTTISDLYSAILSSLDTEKIIGSKDESMHIANELSTGQPTQFITHFEESDDTTTDDSEKSSEMYRSATPSNFSDASSRDDQSKITDSSSLLSQSLQQRSAPSIADKSTAINSERHVPMSFAQRRFWFLTSAVEDRTAFNVTTIVRLQGSLDVARLSNAFALVGERHEAIRTAFFNDSVTKRPMQAIIPDLSLQLEYAMVADERQVEDVVQELRDYEYDLSSGNSIRLKLLSFSDNRHVLILGYHHIAVDGVGNQIFFRDLEKAYNGTLHLSADMMQYPDFTLKEQDDFRSGRWEEHLKYWRDQFQDLPPTMPLCSISHKATRPEMLAYESYSEKLHLDADLKVRIQEVCSKYAIRPFHFYVAVFQVLLLRHTNFEHNDICIGIANSNRTDARILQSLGLFLNAFPLRLRSSEYQSFSETLQQVKRASDGATQHSIVPFDVLLSELKVQRYASHSPLFQTLFNYQQNISDSRKICGCEAIGEVVAPGENGYDIGLDIVDSRSSPNSITLSVNSTYYTKEHAQVLLRSFISLVDGFVADPTTKLTVPPLYLEQDINEAVSMGQGFQCGESEWPLTLCHRIDDVVEKFPDVVALADGSGSQITYAELARKCSHLATELKLKGIGAGCFVGILQVPSNIWTLSLLAILRVGACCLPLDRSQGLGRLLQIIKDCEPALILTDSETEADLELLQSTDTSLVSASDLLLSEVSQQEKVNEAKPADGAILAYTSGTTGVPKGSIIRHESYRNFFEFAVSRWRVRLGREVVLQQSTYSFDMAIAQIFLCLSYGGTLVTPLEHQRSDPGSISTIMRENGVTLTLATPTEYSAWLRYDNGRAFKDSQWHTAIAAGEKMNQSLPQLFSSFTHSKMHFVNCYGPSETTLGCADQSLSIHTSDTQDIDNREALSVFPNYSVQIVDADLKPVPLNVTGQIVIGGAGVVDGYLNRKQETLAAFMQGRNVSDLFKEKGWLSAHISGDSGYLTSKGCLVVKGRMKGSTQVKIGGIRVDLEDIESNILSLSPNIHQAIVSLRKGNADSGSEFLVAFLVMKEQTESPTQQSLEAILQSLPLPKALHPSRAIVVDSLPVTLSNKVDRAAVDDIPIVQPRQSTDDTGQVALEGTSTEQQLFQLWREVLPSDLIGARSTVTRSTDFFVAGGNSLTLLALQSLIREKFHVHVPIMSFFKASTLGQMAATIERTYDPTSLSGLEVIDWDQETSIPVDFTMQLRHSYKDNFESEGVVVLTGSTGFLGRRILSHLLSDSSVRKVHCIAVRKPISELPSIFTGPKVQVHDGDLRLKQLGLSDSSAATIFSESSVVIHCGANVSFLESYSTLRQTNLASTQEVARLCISHGVPLHYISTASVTQMTGADSWGPSSVSAFAPVSGAVNGFGYKSSKWASEVFLERVSVKFNLPVVIHRPAGISGEGANETDLMANILGFAKKIGAVPDSVSWRGFLDMVDVDTVAAKIMKEVKTRHDGTDNVRYVYEHGDEIVPVQKLGEYFEKVNGKAPSVLPFKEWVIALGEAGMNPFLAKYLEQVRDEDGIIILPRLFSDDESAM